MSSTSTRGKLQYLRDSLIWNDVKPYEIKGKVQPGQARNNVDLEGKVVAIEDARVLTDAPSLEKHGFQWFHCPTDESFDSQEGIDRYLSHMTDFMKAQFASDFVFIQEYRLRKRVLDPRTPQYRPVSSWVHVDITPEGAEDRIRRECPAQAETILNGMRYQFVSVWRPLFGPLEDCPLAVCDARTVCPRDLVAMDIVYPTCLVEMFAVTSNPNHRWYFLDGQGRDEVLVITNFDSEDQKCVPHSSFELEPKKDGARPRESIEFRALIASKRVGE